MDQMRWHLEQTRKHYDEYQRIKRYFRYWDTILRGNTRRLMSKYRVKL